ncbi:MAG: (Fe-S)-binding protein, partial [Burkholderiaceae bacterium]|nr:(Fe-S)-binding protein [Burkholderiaceae bacterium]
MRVGLFVTCLIDLVRPEIGFSVVKLLENAGCTVEVPEQQTCCGQPAYNSGDSGTARALAEQVLRAFEGFDYVVLASGSCASSIKGDYVDLFRDDPDLRARFDALAAKTYE